MSRIRLCPANPVVSSCFFRAFDALNQRLGLDPPMPLESLSGTPDRHALIQWDSALRLLRWNVEATGLRDLGIRAVEYAEPNLLDVVDYAARSQSTMGDAIDCIGRLFPLVADIADVSRSDHETISAVTLSTAPLIVQHPVWMEFTLAYLVLAFRRYTEHERLAPREVHFRHEPPADASRYQDFFRTQVRFRMPTDCLIFPANATGLPLVSRDPHLSRMMERIGHRLLKQRESLPTATGRVRDVITRRISRGRGHSDGVAQELGMAQRTLHRHLQQEGSTLRRVVDDVRREFAMNYLQDRGLPVSEIAHRLGFAGATGFHRAFKRWTRTTPGVYRNDSEVSS